MKEGWAKILNVESQRMTGKYHYFKDGSSLCGKYILFNSSVLEKFVGSFSVGCCKKCLELLLDKEVKMKRNILANHELFDIKAQEYERGLKDARPVVGESFVKVYVKMIKKDPHQCTRENLIGMLREAGVEVIIDEANGRVA